MIPRARTTVNGVFLGDSLTEGVGSERISHVTELLNQFRLELNQSVEQTRVHHLRLRSVDPTGFDRFVRFNIDGFMSVDGQDPNANELCIWNLACECRTIETDFEWLPLIAAIRPEWSLFSEEAWKANCFIATPFIRTHRAPGNSHSYSARF